MHVEFICHLIRPTTVLLIGILSQLSHPCW